MRVIGLDISEEMLLMARDKLAQRGLSELVDLIVADAETIPLRGQVFNACTMVGALHHLSAPERAEKMLLTR
jgi:demethylmenaquinone methyltransferase / 2-methoxy-6-polyprenyl-1,4-benzoquinol methylase